MPMMKWECLKKGDPLPNLPLSGGGESGVSPFDRLRVRLLRQAQDSNSALAELVEVHVFYLGKHGFEHLIGA